MGKGPFYGCAEELCDIAPGLKKVRRLVSTGSQSADLWVTIHTRRALLPWPLLTQTSLGRHTTPPVGT